MPDVQAARHRQRELYGEPLAELTGRVRGALGLTQAGLARVLGVSAPMLSQLVSGQRTRIGNPAVVQRLQWLLDLSARAQLLSPDEVAEKIAEIQDAQTVLVTRRESDEDSRAAAVAELRRLAPVGDLTAVGDLLGGYPGLADLFAEAAGAD